MALNARTCQQSEEESIDPAVDADDGRDTERVVPSVGPARSELA